MGTPQRNGRPDYPEMGERLREARRGRNLSLRVLADRLGVSPSLISQIERDKVNPSVSTLWALARELGLNMGYLFDEETGADGRRHGSEGILTYTEAQTVAQQRLIPLAPSFGMDDEKYAAFMSRSLKAMKAFRLR